MVPVLTAEEDDSSADKVGLFIYHCKYIRNNSIFSVLAHIVQLVQLSGGCHCFVIVLAEKKLCRCFRRAEASCGVYPRSYAKADRLGVHGLIRKTADLFESHECRSVGIAYELHTVGNKETVLACKAYYIGNCSDSGKVAELLQRHGVVAAVKSGNQLQSQPCAAHILECGEAVVTVGINYSLSLGELFALLVVVGDDELHAHGVDVLSLGDSRYSVVYGDYKGDSVVGYLIHGFHIETVALGALGDIISNVRPRFCKIGIQNDCGHYAVAVIIAVDTDTLAVFNG